MTQTTKTILISALVSLAIMFTAANWMGWGNRADSNIAAKESTFARVMRTGTIKCGYAVVPPQVIKNPNSGALSGIAHDLMQQIGVRLDLKIEWVEEVPFGTMAEGLNQGRYDAICSGLWNMPSRARAMDFTAPFYFMPAIAIVRGDDHRFDQNIPAINNPAYSVAVVEGTPQHYLWKTRFPAAKIYSLPELSSPAEALESVALKKADVAFYFPSELDLYNRNNPGKTLRNPDPLHPVMEGAASMVVAKGEADLRHMLDLTIAYLLSDGTVEEILRKYEPKAGMFHRAATPYQLPSTVTQ